MTIKKAVFQGGHPEAPHKLGREELLLYTLLSESFGFETAIASEKQMARSKFVMDHETMAVGGIPFVKHALRQLGKPLPEHTPYPEVLRHLLYREVYTPHSLYATKRWIDSSKRLFVKPADWKRFTGFVAEFSTDYRFNGVGNSTPVWASEPVNFISEWRVYVADDVILDTRFADFGGDRTIEPDMKVICEAVELLAKNKAPRGYVVDFGVLDTGETALVEMNDGFSFGAYDGVPAHVVLAVTVHRWTELISKTLL